MLYSVIGNDGCTRCDIVCNILRDKNISFTYFHINDFDPDFTSKMIFQANCAGFTTFPLIYNETTGKYVRLEDVE